jgi:hypothetical protein
MAKTAGGPTTVEERVESVRTRLAWMRAEHIWPNGRRYLWTDAFGLVLLASLRTATGETRWTDQAEELVADVERVLGRERGLRIGEAPERDGQYFHYLAMWIFALERLEPLVPGSRARALDIVRAIHPAFVVPGRGVVWKMREDLSGPYPGYGFGALDPFHGYVVWRLLDEQALAHEIEELRALVEASWRDLAITQDLGLGMMLWMTHFFPDEPWARTQRGRSLHVLDELWIESDGCFSRAPELPDVRYAFTNHGVSIGLQAVGAHPERVERVRAFFSQYRSGDSYDRDAITHVMSCCAELPGELLRHADGS